MIKKQRETTEQEIRDDKVVAIYLSERDRAEQIKKNKELADENQVKRKKNIEAIANSAKTYNDIYRNPFVIANADRNEADIAYKNAVQNVVLNAALQSHGKKRMSINPKAGYEYYDKFTKENEPDLEKTEVLGEVKKDSAAIPVMTIAQKFKAQQESQDF